VLGADGMEKVIEIELDGAEKKLFDASVEHVRTLVEQIRL
jgi:malate/lactate dehydrogenase